jgi:hypothetical protein
MRMKAKKYEINIFNGKQVVTKKIIPYFFAFILILKII